MRAQTVQTIAVRMLRCTALALTLFPPAWMVMASFVRAGRRAAIRHDGSRAGRASINTGRCSRGSTLRGNSELMMVGAVLTVLLVIVLYAALHGSHRR
jgi:hypothetical protein